jgi:3-methyl-2-oxobutanoate hydroxymethyltransferase
MTTNSVSRKKFTLDDLRKARVAGRKLAMLTCYDYSTARLMDEVGIPLILAGDSAANVVLGYPSTLPVSLSFMIEITRAVRRGSPHSFLLADMPFGSYHGSIGSAIRNICRMVKLTECDCVKLEAAGSQLPLVRQLADAGVAVMAHLGLRPQSVAVLGGYKVQGRSQESVHQIVELAGKFVEQGAVSILLEAVPPEVSEQVVAAVDVPVIGCGAGPACHGHVFVTHDGLKLTPRPPKFAPELADVSVVLRDAFRKYMDLVSSGEYPDPAHVYSMKEKTNS